MAPFNPDDFFDDHDHCDDHLGFDLGDFFNNSDLGQGDSFRLGGFAIFSSGEKEIIYDLSGRPLIPSAPEQFLSFNACQVRNLHLGDLLEQLLLDRHLDYNGYQQLVELLSLSFWSGFWQIVYPDDDRLQDTEIECETLAGYLGDYYDQSLVSQSYRRGQLWAEDWLGLNKPS